MEEIELPWWLFEGRPRQGKNVLPDGLNWLCYFAGSSKSHRENSISCIFLESPLQVDMKSIIKCWKDFLWYFATLKIYCDLFHCCILIPRVCIKPHFNTQCPQPPQNFTWIFQCTHYINV